MHRSLIWTALAIIGGLTMLSLFPSLHAQSDEPSMDDKPPVTGIHRAITQEDVWLNTSRALTPEDLRGRIILLDFWTFCCINCIHIIPDLQYLEEKFGNALTVIGVHSAKFANEGDTENIRSAIVRYDIEHPVVNDADFRIWKSFGVRSWPSLVVINPEGKIERAFSGEGHRDELEKLITKMQNEYGDTVISEALPLDLEKHKAPVSHLSFPGKLAYTDSLDGSPALFIADSSNNRIVVTSLDGTIRHTIGTGTVGAADGSFTDAQFNTPQGMLYNDNVLYVADTENHLLRAIDFGTQQVTTLAGRVKEGKGQQGRERSVKDAPARSTPLASPWDLAFFPDTNHIVIAMAGTHQLWTYDRENATVSVLAGNGREYIDDGYYPRNSLSQPSGMSVYGDTLYFVDSETSSLRTLTMDEDGRPFITTLIGTGLFDFGFEDGTRSRAKLQHPLGVYADETGVYIADSYNHSIRLYDPQTRQLSTYAGHGKRGDTNHELAMATFNEPNDILRIDGNFYIADTNNQRIRIIHPDRNTVSTMEVMPAPQQAATREVQEFLPNMERLPDAALSDTVPTTVTIALGEGWKINEAAPSWLVLFSAEGPVSVMDSTVVADYSREEIRTKSIELPVLDSAMQYRLQGTLYYCEDRPESLCLIQSIDQQITSAPDTENAALSIPLSLPMITSE